MHAHSIRDLVLGAAVAAGLALVAGAAVAMDGAYYGGGSGGSAATSSSPTYYQTLAPNGSLAALESATPSLPTALQFDDSSATVSYTRTSSDAASARWELRIRNLVRNHERVDALYQVVLVLPLPAGRGGASGFRALDRAIAPREGSETSSVPLIYGEEKILLKRDVALEKALVPGLIGDPAKGGLPSLAGTGYEYTLWDTVVRYDPQHDGSIQAWASFRYETAADVAPPDAGDPRLNAYLVTWVPSLRSDVLPWAIRMDVAP